MRARSGAIGLVLASNAIDNNVSMIEMETCIEVARVPVGESPKRIAVIIFSEE